MGKVYRTLGFVIWVVGCALCMAVLRPVSSLSPVLLHLLGGCIAGGGAWLITWGRPGGATRLWMFGLLSIGIPLGGCVLSFVLALILLITRKGAAHEGGGIVVGVPSRPLGRLPDPAKLLKAPLLSTQHLMENQQVEGVALGVADVDTSEATRLLSYLGYSQEVGIELFARGAVRQRLENIEKEIKALDRDGESLWNLRGIAELCRRGILSEIVPEEEREWYAQRGLRAADRYLESSPDEIDMLKLRAELLLVERNFGEAVEAIELLGRLPMGGDAALDMGARAIFEAIGAAASREQGGLP